MPASLSSLIDRVRGQADGARRRVQLGRAGQENLLVVLSRVPDPRDARGVRHGLAAVLAMAIAAVLAGNTSFYAIGQWIADAGQKTLKALGARQDPVSGRYVGPDEKTVRRLCARVDGDALDTALGGWLQRRALLATAAKARTGRRPSRDPKARRRARAAGQRRARKSSRQVHTPLMAAVAVDGKASRGAKTPDSKAPHLLAAVTHAGVVLAQRQVDDKSNEITAFIPLLSGLDLAGVVVTADALCRRRHKASYEDFGVMPTSLVEALVSCGFVGVSRHNRCRVRCCSSPCCGEERL